MKRAFFPLFLVTAFVLACAPLRAHELLAASIANVLSEADRLAATKAEEEALSRDQDIKSFPWKGPDGAEGLLIISGEYANFFSMGRCRHLVHIIRHPKDGGMNPTFDATVCRSWEGKWSVGKP